MRRRRLVAVVAGVAVLAIGWSIAGASPSLPGPVRPGRAASRDEHPAWLRARGGPPGPARALLRGHARAVRGRGDEGERQPVENRSGERRRRGLRQPGRGDRRGTLARRQGRSSATACSSTASPPTSHPPRPSELAGRPDVASVQPVSIVHKLNESSVPFIGAPDVWHDFGARGQGMVVADVDTGVDYTHANFGGSGDPQDYADNDPNFVEPGTFPTQKVIGGYDFVGSNYDVLDADPSQRHPASRRRPAGPRRARLAHVRHLLRQWRPRQDRQGRRSDGEAARRQGLGRGQLHRRRAGRRLRVLHGPEPGRRAPTTQPT